jgi:hypothetical protein
LDPAGEGAMPAGEPPVTAEAIPDVGAGFNRSSSL